MSATDLGAAAEAAWNDHLADVRVGDLAGEVQAFEVAVRDKRLLYGDRPAFTVYRPRFIDARELDRLRRETALVMAALERAEEAILAEPDRLLPHLGTFRDEERSFLEIPRRLTRGDLQVRLDAARVAAGYRFFELNGAVPGGIEFTHTSAEVFRATRAYADVAARFRLTGFDLRRSTVDSVLSTWTRFGGSGPPSVAIVDWLDAAPLIEEFRTLQRWLQEAGATAVIADPRDLDYRDGRLSAGGVDIDVVYRRLTTFDMIDRPHEVAALVDAARDGAACLIDPLPQSTLDRKALFAFVTDPNLDPGLTTEEREACRRAVPWTRIVADTQTSGPGGEDVELLQHMRQHRASLVMKPNHDYGGRGLHVGWELGEQEWDVAIDEALGGEWVVQSGIAEASRASYPPTEAPDTLVEYLESTDPYLFQGELGGILTRLSTSTATNVTAGGSAVPTFVVHG